MADTLWMILSLRPTGIELAKLADLPAPLLNEAERVANALSALHAKRENESKGGKIAQRRKALLKVRGSTQCSI